MSQQTEPQRSAFYVWPRAEDQQILLDGTWDLCHQSLPADPAANVDLAAVECASWVGVTVPGMIQWQWYEAGQGPHPYAGTNSRDYVWMEERAWWYRKRFTLAEDRPAACRHELVFDGLDYDARVWLDGVELGAHEGAFGGPVYDVTGQMRAPGEHELLLRLIPAGHGRGMPEDNYRAGRLVKAHTYCKWVNNPDLMTCGIWRSVRLVATQQLRLERPFVRTIAASSETAQVRLDVEILHAQVEPQLGQVKRHGGIPPIWDPAYAPRLDYPDAKVTLAIFDADNKEVAHTAQSPRHTLGRQWLSMNAAIAQPRLWQPNGLGEAYLYRCEVTLEVEGAVVDRVSLSLGIRTIEWVESEAPHVQDAWMPWLMRVNGQDVFLRGINWIPLDLLKLRPEKYRWFLMVAKEAGIQIIHVWGGGLIEDDSFFAICDELGIMVWQDFPLNVLWTCSSLPLDVWEDQVVWSIFRLRSHPSLAIWCGGNEFDPYHPDNAAVLGIMERSLEMLDGTRRLVRACPDPGDVHPYPSCDTTWYWPLYRLAPAITEWGNHALPTAATLGEFMSGEEAGRRLGDLTGLDDLRFAQEHAALRNHWAEFNVSRVPQVIVRASILDDMSNPTLADFTEDVQVASGEVYSTVAHSFRANFPITTLIMPWVYSRPWPSVGMQVIDHSGRIGAGYALKRAYQPDQVILDYPYEALSADEQMTVSVVALHDAIGDLKGARVALTVLNGALDVLEGCAWTVDLAGGPYAAPIGAFELRAPSGADTAFFIRADLLDSSGKLLARTVRWLRTLASLSDEAERTAYRAQPQPSKVSGPQTSVRQVLRHSSTALTCSILADEFVVVPDLGQCRRLSVQARNIGNHPAAFVHWEWTDPAWLLLAEDNYFWLEPGEEATRWLFFAPADGVSSWPYAHSAWTDSELAHLELSAWNAPSVGVS